MICFLKVIFFLFNLSCLQTVDKNMIRAEIANAFAQNKKKMGGVFHSSSSVWSGFCWACARKDNGAQLHAETRCQVDLGPGSGSTEEMDPRDCVIEDKTS